MVLMVWRVEHIVACELDCKCKWNGDDNDLEDRNRNRDNGHVRRGTALPKRQAETGTDREPQDKTGDFLKYQLYLPKCYILPSLLSLYLHTVMKVTGYLHSWTTSEEQHRRGQKLHHVRVR